jgi:hypothetical protein
MSALALDVLHGMNLLMVAFGLFEIRVYSISEEVFLLVSWK